jgi:hypothetical protein
MTMTGDPDHMFRTALPNWVPEGALHYLAHTELGQPIRALARAAGCHASTILRQIRRIETRRDDPLVDEALRRLGKVHQAQTNLAAQEEGADMPQIVLDPTTLPDADTLNREALRILRRLCETGAVLAVASEMEKAVVVRDAAGGGSTRTAVVSSTIAQAMALKDWIAPANTGRIVRYHITAAGRSALHDMLKNPDLRKQDAGGFAEAPANFIGKDEELTDVENARSRRIRYALAESPLSTLARRRDRDGTPFLNDTLVAAGERLREDFELAQMDSRTPQGWDPLLTSGDAAGTKTDKPVSDASSEARGRVAAALGDLGPGLSDVVLRCCCYLEGLETAERRLGWSARSGKVVLRIALMRLQRHYETTIGPGGPMIG